MRDDPPARAGAHVVAWAIHALTASGALWGLLAIVAVGEGRWRAALGWMAVAVLVDGVDGPLARRFEVARLLPRFDGTLLDNLIDYLNYALVPALFILELGVLAPGYDVLGAALICLVSAFQFSHADAKSSDLMFRGFPSYWNIVAAYLLLLSPPPRIALAGIALLAVLVFVPIHFVYPSRTRPYRRLTLILTAAWALCLIVAIARYPETDSRLVYGSLLYGVYYVAISLKLELDRRRARR